MYSWDYFLNESFVAFQSFSLRWIKWCRLNSHLWDNLFLHFLTNKRCPSSMNLQMASKWHFSGNFSCRFRKQKFPLQYELTNVLISAHFYRISSFIFHTQNVSSQSELTTAFSAFPSKKSFFLHFSHTWSFSAVCNNICFLKWSLWENLLLHMSHKSDFSSVSIKRFVHNVLFRQNFKLHMTQTKDLSLEWINRCLFELVRIFVTYLTNKRLFININ